MSKPSKLNIDINLANQKLNNPNQNWVMFPTYGMNRLLNNSYHKLQILYGIKNTTTDNERYDILDVINRIVNDKNIKYLYKLHLINEFISCNKDYCDNYDTILDDAIAFEKEIKKVNGKI